MAVRRVRQHQCFRGVQRDSGIHARGIIACRKIFALPVMMLPQSRSYRASAARDLLVPIEAPQLPAFEIARHQCDGFLLARIRACGCYYHASGQHARRTARRAVVSLPSLHHIAIHVDDDRAVTAQRREHREAVPRFGGIVDRCTCRINRRRCTHHDRRDQSGTREACQRTHHVSGYRPGLCE